jgi:predicted permease
MSIMPDRSGFPFTMAVWLPLAHIPGLSAQPRDARALRVFGRLRDGLTVADARAELEAATGRLAEAHPDTNASSRARVVPINERFLGRLEGPWLAFIAAGCIIVLIACANVANLMLARGLHRAHEIAIRTSLGASRPRLVRQLLIEGTLLALAGGALGVLVSVGGVRLFRSAIPAGALPYWIDYTMDARVLGVLVTVSLVSVCLFALVPAIQASRADVNAALKDGGRTGPGSRGSRWWTTGFLAAELALAVVLLAQVGLAALVSRSTVPSDAIVRTTDVLTATITLPAARYRTPDDRARFFRQLEERLTGAAGISAVAMTSHLPQSGALERFVEIEGATPPAGTAPGVSVVEISRGYFDTLSLPLIRGRGLSEADGQPAQSTAIANERFVEMFLDRERAVGARIALHAPGAPAAPPAWTTIVGIAPNIRQRSAPDPGPVISLPMGSTSPPTVVLMVRAAPEGKRSAMDPAGLTAFLRSALLAIDANVPLYHVQTLAAAIDDAQWNPRVSARLALTLTFLSVLLATVGLYAVTAHGVSLRTREIGVRMALGARTGHVLRVVLRSIRVPLALGLAMGIAGAVAWDRAFASGAPGLHASDPAMLLAITASVGVLTLIACVVPARWAMRVDPAAAIRTE